jgi:hypothetical protein
LHRRIGIFAAIACPERSRRLIPENVWYLIPSFLLLGPKRRHAVKNRYSFESYKEAWPLLSKSKRALTAAYQARR